MITPEELQSLHSNQRLFVEELLRRGVQVVLLVPELELLEARFNAHIELVLDRDTSVNPYNACVICSDKYLTKKILQRAGLQVPAGEQFFADQHDDALAYGRALGFPLVVKPCVGSHGEGCFSDVDTEEKLKGALDELAIQLAKERAFLIEKQKPGMEFRIFLTRNGACAVLHRDPAHVFGDGKSTIARLAEAESYRRMHPRRNALCPIVIDAAVKRHLAGAGLTLESVPAAGAKIYLRRNSNIAQGGNCEDYTARAHPTVIELAKQALAAIPGLPYAGIDLLSIDIERAQDESSYCILEINSNPGLHMHMRPGTGAGQNVAAYLADLVFPETRGL